MALEKLDLLILKTLALAPLHGYGIGQRIEQMSGGVFRITLGALYPALQRLERSGLREGIVVRLREQPARALLHADGRRPAAAVDRPEGLGAHRGRDDARAPADAE